MKRGKLLIAAAALAGLLSGCSQKDSEDVVLRISNWEEYIDLGGWGDDEAIDLDDDLVIFGENSLVEDFENWYYETYGLIVKVEYSTFGTNEELYNQITIGDVYDLVCPSEYMIMKMMREDMLLPYSEEFKDDTIEENYYARGLSPFIRNTFEELNFEGESIAKYAAGYMWGTLGIVYNPEEITEEEASTWKLFLDEDHFKRMTVKDSVRDAYFAAAALCYYDEITSEEFLSSDDYLEKLTEVLNRTDSATVEKVEDILSAIRKNAYSFETDSGKADMVTGKVIANQQWSGDAVYTLDQAEEDDYELCYSCPEEGTNMWFDGWVMLKSGISQDARKRHAAEAFVNFVSKPENAVRNMYYIGYTSVISGGDDETIFLYADWNYSAEEDEEDVVDYEIGYFFSDDEEEWEDYVITCPESQTRRQLYAQYPPHSVMERSVVMACFPEEDNTRINRMWTNVRCFDILEFFGIK